MSVAILRFPGTWSERDFEHVLREVMRLPAEIVWHEEAADLSAYDAVVVPGGFAYGDYLRAGAIARLSPALAALGRFADRGGLVLGSCNGFQILCESGLLPGALVRNDHLEFRCDWVRMRVESARSPWLEGLAGRVLRMPIAHGEGNYHVAADTLARLEANGQIALRYCDESGAVTREANPNGSIANVAGVTNERGNVLGLMPHPERCGEALLGGTDGLLLLGVLERVMAATGTRY